MQELLDVSNFRLSTNHLLKIDTEFFKVLDAKISE